MESNNNEEYQEENQLSIQETLNRFREDYLDGKKVIVQEDDGEYD